MDLPRILILIISISLISSQLSKNDKEYIKNLLLSQQDSTTGLFNKNYVETYRSVYSLLALNVQIPNVNKICREISFELESPITYEVINLNKLLNCNLQFKNINSLFTNLNELYDYINNSEILGVNVDYTAALSELNNYLTVDNLFANYSNKTDISLKRTGYGLSLLNKIYYKVKNDTKIKIKEQMETVFKNIEPEFQLISDNSGLFTDISSSSLEITSLLIPILNNLNKIIKNDKLEQMSYKILNYLIENKYSFTDNHNIYYLIHGLVNLKNIPLLKIDKNTYDITDKLPVNFTIYSGLGEEIQLKDIIKYKVVEKVEIQDEESLDLKDEIESKENTIKLSGKSKFSLNLSSVSKPGKYDLQISFSKYTSNIEILAFSKIKIEHIKLSVSNDETVIEYPKRSFKSLKVTQNTILNLKVKINHLTNDLNKLEQIFVRLRHVDLGKSYSSYVKSYNDGYYHITFDMGDSNTIEAYDGIYELTLVLSDVSYENPIIWNFGKVEAKFRKPLDPTNLSSSFKNIQKPKMEPHFPPEVSLTKNFISGVLFSVIIILASIYYLVFLKGLKLNISNFPSAKEKSNYIFAILFMIVLSLIAYIMLLFWLRLNIIQTLIVLSFVALPSSFVVFKALQNITIEI